MKEASLPSPGVGAKSMHLRRIAANAISSLEKVASKYSNGINPNAAALSTFFAACKAAADALAKAIPAMTFTTAGGATSVAVAGTLATTVVKGGSSGAVTYSSSDTAIATVNGSGVITGVRAGPVIITATMAEGAGHQAASRTVGINVT